MRIEDFIRVGVDPVEEAARVEETLTRAGWERTRRIDGEGFVALAFARNDRRAVRITTSRGIAVALDSHEPDGVRLRHGAVSLIEGDASDLDGDGRVDVVVSREEGSERCLAVLRIAEDGDATVAPIEAEALAPGACASELADIDGDGVVEALVTLRWPDLAIDGQVATLTAVLVLEDGGWRAGPMPVAYVEREEASRRDALMAARAARDVPSAARLGVELAALAHSSGAALSAQIARLDAALSGLVLTETQAAEVAAVRAVIAAGWQAPTP